MTAQDWIERNFDRNMDYVLITGASSGIGYEYLRAFAKMGCKCIATSNDAEGLSTACSVVRSNHDVEIEQFVADLCTLEGVQKFIQAIQEYRVGVLINNAGFGLKGEFCNHSLQKYMDIIILNSLAPTLICRTVLPRMIEVGRGLILHVASINACTPIAYNAVYTATKAFVLYYAYAIAYECRSSSLVFQVVLPGTTNTPFHERQGAVPQSMFMNPDIVVHRSLGRINSPINISNRLDRVLFPIFSWLPYSIKIRLATYMLKKRLKQKDI